MPFSLRIQDIIKDRCVIGITSGVAQIAHLALLLNANSAICATPLVIPGQACIIGIVEHAKYAIFAHDTRRY